MNSSIEEIRQFIGESMRGSSSQAEYYKGVRTFFRKREGKYSKILMVIDLLHHPQKRFKTKALNNFFRFLKNSSELEIWTLAEKVNMAKNSEEFRREKLFEPVAVSYFYDLKAFLLNILFLMMLDGGKFSRLNTRGSLAIITKDGYLLSFREDFITCDNGNEKLKTWLISYESREETSRAKLLEPSSRGIHAVFTEIEPRVISKLANRPRRKEYKKCFEAYQTR